MLYGHRGQVWGVLLAFGVLCGVVGGCANDGGDDAQSTPHPAPMAPFTPGPSGTPPGPLGPSTPITGGPCPVCRPPCTPCLICRLGKPCGETCIDSQAPCPQQTTCTCGPPTG